MKELSIDDLTAQEAMDIAVAKCFKQDKQKQEVEGNPNTRKPTLRIVKGKSYLCIKDYRDKNCTFTKGKIYESDKDGFLVDDEEKNTFERKIWEEDAIEYFYYSNKVRQKILLLTKSKHLLIKLNQIWKQNLKLLLQLKFLLNLLMTK